MYRFDLKRVIVLLQYLGVKRADSSTGKQLPPPKDACNLRDPSM